MNPQPQRLLILAGNSMFRKNKKKRLTEVRRFFYILFIRRPVLN